MLTSHPTHRQVQTSIYLLDFQRVHGDAFSFMMLCSHIIMELQMGLSGRHAHSAAAAAHAAAAAAATAAEVVGSLETSGAVPYARRRASSSAGAGASVVGEGASAGAEAAAAASAAASVTAPGRHHAVHQPRPDGAPTAAAKAAVALGSNGVMPSTGSSSPATSEGGGGAAATAAAAVAATSGAGTRGYMSPATGVNALVISHPPAHARPPSSGVASAPPVAYHGRRAQGGGGGAGGPGSGASGTAASPAVTHMSAVSTAASLVDEAGQS